ncbi:MAG: HAMP domain-containing histidine kinase [Cyanobacteria bacterium]|nr:HAMP domain-containing histidine kinase [Cyanobacteriota bacterium]
MKSRLARKGLILAGVPLVFELVFIAALIMLFHQEETISVRALQSKLIVSESESLLHDMWDTFGQIGLCFATDRPIDMSISQGLTARTEAKLRSLKNLSAGDKEQLHRLDRLGDMLIKALQDFQLAAAATEEQEPFAKAVYPPKLVRSSKKIADALAEFTEVESKRQLEMPLSNQQARVVLSSFVLFGVIMNVCIAIALMNFFGKGITSRLSSIVDNIQNMKEGRPLLLPVKGDDDEIAVLDREFHSMASYISEARRKEQALVGNVRSVICSLDRNLEFTKVSDEASRVWGNAEYIGTSLKRLCDTEGWEKIAKVFESCENTNNLSAAIDIRMLPVQGGRLWMHWSIFWSKEHENYFCVANDITRQKELQDLKRDFAQMISHDLRSPLQSIQAFFEVLECGIYGTLNERGMPRLLIVNKTVSHLIRLINNLLDLDKMDEGLLELRLEESKLQELIETSFEFISELAEKRNLNVTIDIGEDALVSVDRDKIIQVFQNLLGNAVKYAPPSSSLDIKSRMRSHYMEIEIIDQGKGIPIDQQEKIFDRFHQVKDEQGKAVAGTGLGLAFCKQIVDLHGGQIGVESTVGTGSTFWLLLPLAHRAGTATTQRLESPGAGPL